jgi:hypothetical protein
MTTRPAQRRSERRGHPSGDLAVELYRNADLRAAAKADETIGASFRYEALLGDRDPALDYRD